MVDARVVSRSEWLVARRELLAREKEFTRCRDELAARRRTLPLVEIEKPYSFAGPGRRSRACSTCSRDGVSSSSTTSCSIREWDEGCPSCSFNVDNIGDHLEPPSRKRTTFAARLARAAGRAARLQAAAWAGRLPWYSSFGSDFNYDFHATLDRRSRPVEYNYRRRARARSAGQTYRHGRAGAARGERLPARRRPGLPQLLDLRARARHLARHLQLARPDPARTPRGVGASAPEWRRSRLRVGCAGTTPTSPTEREHPARAAR